MIPVSYVLKKYEDLPLFQPEQIQKEFKNKKIVFHNELIVDITNFSHPGNLRIIQPYINNIQANIQGSFQSYNHSQYAQIIICLNTIGKLKKISSTSKDQRLNQKNPQRLKDFKPKGKQLFQKISNSQRLAFYTKTINKINFKEPLYDQIDSLTPQQKQIITQIPTDLKNSSQTKFKNTLLQEIKYTNNFWISTTFFQLWILKYLYYFFTLDFHQNQTHVPELAFYFCIGIIKWTLIEYYFHRFLLHWNIKIKPIIGDHLMHHAFPNMKNKLALSISRIIPYFIIFHYLYPFLLQQHQKSALMFGTLFGLTFYDILHYYFHFGPEINISWLVKLKRNHLKHHYRDQSKGFGVTNTLWDNVFGTSYSNNKPFDKQIGTDSMIK